MSTLHERRLARMPSAQHVVHHASDFKSPLAHVKSMAQALPAPVGHPGPSSLAHRQSPSTAPPEPVPALDFNLFRSNSVYSVSSINTISSFDTTSDEPITRQMSISSDLTSSDEDEVQALPPVLPAEFSRDLGGSETPTTPKADRTHYFDLGPPIAAGAGPGSQVEELASGQVTPKRSFFVRSRPGLPNTLPSAPPAPPPAAPAFLTPADFYKAGPSTSSRMLSETHHDVFAPPPRSSSRSRADSITREGEISALHPQRQSIGLEDWESVHGEQGSEWGDDEEGFEWLDTDGGHAAVNGNQGKANTSPGKRLAKLRDAVPGFGSASGGADGAVRKLKKRHLVLPSRAAPPPPPGPGSPRQVKPHDTISSSHPYQHPPNLHNNSRRAPIPGHISLPNIRAHHLAASGPTMVPLRDPTSGPNPALSRLKLPNSRASGMSVQSNAFSIYDLDGGASSPSADTPRVATPGGTELAFPKGTYTKVPASVLTRPDDIDARRRGTSDSNRQPPHSPLLDPRETSRDDLLGKGVEARGKGDLPKAAWYFRQSADAGSSTGRIYWGLALRHGWGVAKDERKAFAELRAACDESIAHGSKELPSSADGGKLTIQQKKAMARDISLGMFEVANCFLDGVGVKKDSEVAVSYLRFAGDLGDLASQEQLGFLLSKGGNGIKKDMKEAAKWYRMAIGQGTTTIGLAWVWKEKYMT